MATKKKQKPLVPYIVNIDMRYSHDIHVKARTATEAKTKAFNKLVSRLKMNDFNVYADKND